MDIQRALVHVGACESYRDATDLLLKGRVTLNGKRVDAPWFQLRGGYYAINIKSVAMYRFNIRRGKVGRVKTTVYLEEASE
jgi:ribosomal protein S4